MSVVGHIEAKKIEKNSENLRAPSRRPKYAESYDFLSMCSDQTSLIPVVVLFIIIIIHTRLCTRDQNTQTQLGSNYRIPSQFKNPNPNPNPVWPGIL